MFVLLCTGTGKNMKSFYPFDHSARLPKFFFTVKPTQQNNDTWQVLAPELFHFTTTFPINFCSRVERIQNFANFYYKIELYWHIFRLERLHLRMTISTFERAYSWSRPFWRCFVKIYMLPQKLFTFNYMFPQEIKRLP